MAGKQGLTGVIRIKNTWRANVVLKICMRVAVNPLSLWRGSVGAEHLVGTKLGLELFTVGLKPLATLGSQCMGIGKEHAHSGVDSSPKTESGPKAQAGGEVTASHEPLERTRCCEVVTGFLVAPIEAMDKRGLHERAGGGQPLGHKPGSQGRNGKGLTLFV